MIKRSWCKKASDYSRTPASFYYLCPWLTALSTWYWPYKECLSQFQSRPLFYEGYLKCSKSEGFHQIQPNYNYAQLIDGEAYLFYVQAISRGEIWLPRGQRKPLTIEQVKTEFSLFKPSDCPSQYILDLRRFNPDSLGLM